MAKIMCSQIDAGDNHIRLAKIPLGVTRRMGQRHEHLLQTMTIQFLFEFFNVG